MDPFPLRQSADVETLKIMFKASNPPKREIGISTRKASERSVFELSI